MSTKLTLEEKKDLIRMAFAARKFAYTPYSHFQVGAALRAERTALFKAVSQGVHEFTDIAIVGSKEGEVNEQITSPCGVCRQALFEFGGKDLNVIMAKSEDDFIEADLNTLLPYGFGPSNVEGNSALD